MSLTKKLMAIGSVVLLGIGAGYYFSRQERYSIRKIPPQVMEEIQRVNEEQQRSAEEEQRQREELRMEEVVICGQRISFPGSAYINEVARELRQDSIDEIWGSDTIHFHRERGQQNPPPRIQSERSEMWTPGDIFAVTHGKKYHSVDVDLSFYFGQLFQIQMRHPRLADFGLEQQVAEILHQQTGEGNCKTGVELLEVRGLRRIQLYDRSLREASWRRSALTTNGPTFRSLNTFPSCPSTETILADVHPAPGIESIKLLCEQDAERPHGFVVYATNNQPIVTHRTNEFMTRFGVVNVLTDSLQEIRLSEYCYCQMSYDDIKILKFQGNTLRTILDAGTLGEDRVSLQRIFLNEGRPVIELQEGQERKRYIYNPSALQFEAQP